jgi:cytochrome c5
MTTNQSLAEQIEQLVREHLAASRAAVGSAVERAFAGTSAVAGSHARPTKAAGTRARPKTRATAAPRRAVEEVTALGEQFYGALCRNPGATMATLAPQVGASPRALHVAVARLKRAGRVRAVGQRRLTHYFPMTTTATVAAA